jgi:hypothetical protein
MCGRGDGSLAFQRGDHSVGGAGLAREILRATRVLSPPMVDQLAIDVEPKVEPDEAA